METRWTKNIETLPSLKVSDLDEDLSFLLVTLATKHPCSEEKSTAHGKLSMHEDRGIVSKRAIQRILDCRSGISSTRRL